jgi:hypothetical protein
LRYGGIGDQQFQAHLAQGKDRSEDDGDGAEPAQPLHHGVGRQAGHDIEPHPRDE